MNVLVVVAHPDDAEIAMAMRMRWHVLRGDRIWVHCLTTGTPNRDGHPIRADECRQAGQLLGVQRYTFSTVPDCRFEDHRGVINDEMFALFDRAKPSIVYTHYPHDQHLDHQVTADETTVVARREARDMYYFRSPLSLGFEPTLFFLGTDKLLDLKARALACFTSQTQLDMPVFEQLDRVAFRQYLHHRVVRSFPATTSCAELFRIERQLQFADQAPDKQCPDNACHRPRHDANGTA